SHTRGGQSLMAFARAQQRPAILEAFCTESCDPKRRVCPINVRRDHSASAEIKAELNRHQHNRKQDADERYREPHAVMEEITECECQDHLPTRRSAIGTAAISSVM